MATNNAVNVPLSGSTGTGNFVGANSPSLITPNLGVGTFTQLMPSVNGGALYDSSGNPILALTNVGSPVVNYTTITNAVTGAGPTLRCSGSDTNIIFAILGKGNGGAAVQGNTAGGFSVAGYYGEVISSTFVSGVSVLTSTVTNVHSLSIPAGDWDIRAVLYTSPAGGTIAQLTSACLNLASATLPPPSSVATASLQSCGLMPASTGASVQTGTYPLSVSGATTIYLNCFMVFTVSTMTVGGMILARRVR